MLFSVVVDVNIEENFFQIGINWNNCLFLIQAVIFTKKKQNSLTHKSVLISCIFLNK